MYCLYDREGILRYVNSDKKACLDYADLFGLSSTSFCLMNYVGKIDEENITNLDLNQEESNS